MHLNLHLKLDEILINLSPAYSLSGAICSMARSKWLANHPVSPWNLQTAQCFLSLMLLCTIVAFPRSHEYGANSKAGVAVDREQEQINPISITILIFDQVAWVFELFDGAFEPKAFRFHLGAQTQMQLKQCMGGGSTVKPVAWEILAQLQRTRNFCLTMLLPTSSRSGTSELLVTSVERTCVPFHETQL